MRCTKEILQSYFERKIVANVQNSVFRILSELWQSFISCFRFKDAANVDLSFECHVGAYILSTLILRNLRVFRKFWGINVCEWESCFFFPRMYFHELPQQYYARFIFENWSQIARFTTFKGNYLRKTNRGEGVKISHPD